MAESILYSVAANLIKKLGSLALKEIQFLWGIDDELEKLKHTISAMEAVLHDAEEQQFKSHAVKNWVSRLRDAFYDVDDFIDEFSYETLRRQVMAKEVRRVFSKANQISFRFKMSHKIKEMREGLKAIDEDKNQFHFSERLITMKDDELRKKRETFSFIHDDEVIGRDDDKKAIMNLLLNSNNNDNVKENIAVIAIVGMGGLGKTALAQSIYNNEKITKHFKLKLWVCISEEFDVKVIVEKIIESATRKKPEILQMDVLQSELRRQIDGKKYLLIMDDVWNEDYEKWVHLKRLLMGGAKGSRILITTRHQRVAETFDTASSYPLGELDDKSAWLLFKKMALGGEESKKELENSNLVKIGKEIVIKLKGVPLAIRIIGRLLFAKRSELHLWLSSEYDELYRVMEQREEAQFMRSILELSYNHLPSNLKQCFLYCVLFPKGYNIQKDEVIKQWVAQGFIQSNGIYESNDIGEDYFMELLSRSFFQDVTVNEMGDIIECKMHDFMHDLACSIVENEYVSVDVNDMAVNKRTRHIAMDPSFGIKLKSIESLLEAKHLRTLIIEAPDEDYQKLHSKIPSSFMRLRTLSLSFCWIESLPTSISKLKHLRYLKIVGSKLRFLPNSITELYNLETLILNHCFHLQELPRDAKKWINLKYLNLTQNWSIKFLPDSITELYNLEELILDGCESLQELPKNIKNWINLKHLDMHQCTALTHMPKGLGELTSLQTMNVLVLSKDNRSQLSELNGLNKLRGSLTIQGLKFCSTVDMKMNSGYLLLKSGLRHLKLDWNYFKDNEPPMNNIALDESDCERILECLQPHSNVRKIHICGYLGVRICNWLSSNTLDHLVNIQLSKCIKLKHLPKFHQFPFLKHLCLASLPCIEYIDNSTNDYLSSSMFFPSLEKLSILDMPSLKGWWKGETSSKSSQNNVSFPRIIVPCLSQLVINGCPKLASIPWHAPTLQSLEMSWVSLQLLNVVMKMTTSLRFVYIENIPELEYLPNCIMQQCVTTLQSIFIENCPNLRILPEGISELTSLLSLRIRACPKLTSLPEGIRQLHSLQSLEIWNCFELAERCKEGIGEDWPKISHVPHVDIL